MKGIRPLICILMLAGPLAARADCSTIADPIDTDRPDSPDDSATVPKGSLQIENGAGISRSGGTISLDAPETRLRYGLQSCTEILIDLPDYTHAFGSGARGFGDIAPGLKHQFEGLPEPFQLWLAAGVALPTGARQIAGRGAQPYLQVPVSVDLDDGVTLAGQYVVTFHPGDVETAPEHQASLDLEVDASETLGLFIEYIGAYRHGESPSNSADLGATYRLDNTHQVDFVVGKGLSSAAPDWYFSVGYSLRFDQLF